MYDGQRRSLTGQRWNSVATSVSRRRTTVGSRIFAGPPPDAVAGHQRFVVVNARSSRLTTGCHLLPPHYFKLFN